MAAVQGIIRKRAINPEAKYKAMYIKYMINGKEVTKKVITRKQ